MIPEKTGYHKIRRDEMIIIKNGSKRQNPKGA